MITVTISYWSVCIGIVIGLSISFFAMWLTEKLISKEDRWGIGFSSGWKCGTEYMKTKAEDNRS